MHLQNAWPKKEKKKDKREQWYISSKWQLQKQTVPLCRPTLLQINNGYDETFWRQSFISHQICCNDSCTATNTCKEGCKPLGLDNSENWKSYYNVGLFWKFSDTLTKCHSEKILLLHIRVIKVLTQKKVKIITVPVKQVQVIFLQKMWETSDTINHNN